MKYADMVNDALKEITEVFPWDVEEMQQNNPDLLLLDIREPYEFEQARITGSINVPRGILESACDWGYDETVPELATARDRDIVVICRSGWRSVLAVVTMKLMGYRNPVSLKTGLRGWNDSEQHLENAMGETVDVDDGDVIFENRVSPDQMEPK